MCSVFVLVFNVMDLDTMEIEDNEENTGNKTFLTLNYLLRKILDNLGTLSTKSVI